MPADTSDTHPINSVWTRAHRPQREQLTREQIVTTAIEMLDAEGVAALSMRKLGSRMGAAATSLYRHVANRDELIQLAVDEAYGEIKLPDTATGTQWRPEVTHLATELRDMVLRHPWIAPELGQVGLIHIGPNATRMASGVLAQFEAAGFPADETDQAMGTLMAYVIGNATTEAAYLSLIARSGKTEREWVAGLRPAFDEASQDHPRLRAGSSARQDLSPRRIRDDSFAYGLDRVLDGLVARLRRS